MFILKKLHRLRKIKKLKDYFSDRDDAIMAFVFGSQGRERARSTSDWDIAVYLVSQARRVEWETNRDYREESEILRDLIKILETDSVDLVVLNRAPATIAASAIKGLPLIIKDKKIYLEFMLEVTREAEDYRRTAEEYAEIYWRSTSLSEEDKDILNKRLVFLDSELQDAAFFRSLTMGEYESDRMKRREVERWIENLVNAAIDIAKTLLASEKRPIPDTYREILRLLGTLPYFSSDVGDELAKWAELRNILAHEYLDIRWKRIEDFIKRSEPYFKQLVEVVKDLLSKR